MDKKKFNPKGQRPSQHNIDFRGSRCSLENPYAALIGARSKILVLALEHLRLKIYMIESHTRNNVLFDQMMKELMK